jgi:hypothetical protein
MAFQAHLDRVADTLFSKSASSILNGIHLANQSDLSISSFAVFNITDAKSNDSL